MLRVRTAVRGVGRDGVTSWSICLILAGLRYGRRQWRQGRG